MHGYLPNKSNDLNQDIIKFVIGFLKKSGRFDKPLFSLNQCFYILLFFFLPTRFLYVVVVLFVCFIFYLLENKCKFAAYNWLQISCINSLLLIILVLLLLFLFVTSSNLQTLNVLCSFIIGIWFIMNVESFVFLYVLYLAFLVF